MRCLYIGEVESVGDNSGLQMHCVRGKGSVLYNIKGLLMCKHQTILDLPARASDGKYTSLLRPSAISLIPTLFNQIRTQSFICLSLTVSSLPPLSSQYLNRKYTNLKFHF